MDKIFVVSEVWSDFGREKYNILGAATDYEKARKHGISESKENATWCVDEVELID